jgi:hypothetical protein
MQFTNGPSDPVQMGLLAGHTVWAQEQSIASCGHGFAAQPTVIDVPMRTQTCVPGVQVSMPHGMGIGGLHAKELRLHAPALQRANVSFPLVGHVGSR